MKKIAFVHDRLYYIAWAEQVFFDQISSVLQCHNITMSQSSTEAPRHWSSEAVVFVMFSDKHSLEIDGHKIPIVTALPNWAFSLFVFFDKNKVWLLSKLFDYRNLMFFYPLLIWILQGKIKSYKPDEIHISSFAVAKNIALTNATMLQSDNATKSWSIETLRHWSIETFLHAQSPFMYIHNHFESNLSKLKFPIKQFYKLAYCYLKPWDIKARQYDSVVANSHYTAWLMHSIYGLNVNHIQYPKLDPLFFSYPLVHSKSDYFIFIGRLVCFSKQVDIIIQAFNQTGQKLKIVWSGPDEHYLKSIAKPNIEFLGRISDPEQRCASVSNACALVNITLESFGYVTAESLCLGTPVVGYNAGATPELVLGSHDLRTKSWILIEHQTSNALMHALEEFQTHERDHKLIATQARSKFQSSTTQFQLA